MLSNSRKEQILEKVAWWNALKSVGQAAWGAAKASKFSPGAAMGNAQKLWGTLGSSAGRASLAKSWKGMSTLGRQKLVANYARQAAAPALYGTAGLYGASKLMGGRPQPRQTVNVYR